MKDNNGEMNRTAINIIKKYGRDRFLFLIACFKNSISYRRIAEEFGVSRQRVFQWKRQMGQTKKVFYIYKDIENLINIDLD